MSTPTRRGASHARNLGAERASGELLLFLDDDVSPPTEGLDQLLRYFHLPSVVAVAPRVIQAGSEPHHSRAFPLDMGPHWSYVTPRSQVRYLPTALLVIRREAFVAANGFDETLSVGEDVDLIWRIGRNGDVLYEPSVIARHNRITTTTERFLRSYRYGLSYAPLHQRFPENVRTKPATFYEWLALALPPLGGRGIVVTSLLPAVKPALSRELREHFGARVQVELVAEIVRRVLRSCIERWSHELILPLGILSLVSRRARRSLEIIATVAICELLIQSQWSLQEVEEYFIGALGYSTGYVRSLLLRWTRTPNSPSARSRTDQTAC